MKKHLLVEKMRLLTNEAVTKPAANKCLIRCFEIIKQLNKQERESVEILLCQNYIGSIDHCDPMWRNEDPKEWKHYVLRIGEVIFDPTIKQINEMLEPEFSLSFLRFQWAEISAFTPPQEFFAD